MSDSTHQLERLRAACEASGDIACDRDPVEDGRSNRDRLREALDRALCHALRENVAGAFLVVGVDRIDMVNQAFGYEVADAALLSIGRGLERCLGAGDRIGRLGGDRFGIVLGNCPAAQIAQAAETLLETARNTQVHTRAGPIHVTCSLGAVVFPQSARVSPDVMTRAEIALRIARRAGSSSWSIYSYSEDQRLGHRRDMVLAEQVNRALQEDRLSLAFQPIVRSRDFRPAMYECLLRMRRPDGGIVPAGVFMPVAEELGLVRLIDRRVFELAVDGLTAYPQARLALNVSALTATDSSWLGTTVATLRPRPEIAERLVVEITETAGLDDMETCARFVSTLRDLGCRVALDDFGAGYTSFRHLKMLDIDMVKIDGSFVRDLGSNPDNLVFIRTLLGLADALGLETVGECVERMEDAELLRAEGVGLLQGYAFGRPSLEPPWTEAGPDLAFAPAAGSRFVPARAS